MPHINTWVYMDLESTGLKKERPRVTDEDDDDDEFDDMADKLCGDWETATGTHPTHLTTKTWKDEHKYSFSVLNLKIFSHEICKDW